MVRTCPRGTCTEVALPWGEVGGGGDLSRRPEPSGKAHGGRSPHTHTEHFLLYSTNVFILCTQTYMMYICEKPTPLQIHFHVHIKNRSIGSNHKFIYTGNTFLDFSQNTKRSSFIYFFFCFLNFILFLNFT